jgi:hypothetical protein
MNYTARTYAYLVAVALLFVGRSTLSTART